MCCSFPGGGLIAQTTCVFSSVYSPPPTQFQFFQLRSFPKLLSLWLWEAFMLSLHNAFCFLQNITNCPCSKSVLGTMGHCWVATLPIIVSLWVFFGTTLLADQRRPISSRMFCCWRTTTWADGNHSFSAWQCVREWSKNLCITKFNIPKIFSKTHQGCKTPLQT